MYHGDIDHQALFNLRSEFSIGADVCGDGTERKSEADLRNDYADGDDLSDTGYCRRADAAAGSYGYIYVHHGVKKGA